MPPVVFSLVAFFINAMFSCALFVVPSNAIMYVAMSKSSRSSTSFLYCVVVLFKCCFFSVPIIVRRVHASNFQLVVVDACALFNRMHSFVATPFHLVVSVVRCISDGLRPYCLARLYNAVPS